MTKQEHDDEFDGHDLPEQPDRWKRQPAETGGEVERIAKIIDPEAYDCTHTNDWMCPCSGRKKVAERKASDILASTPRAGQADTQPVASAMMAGTLTMSEGVIRIEFDDLDAAHTVFDAIEALGFAPAAPPPQGQAGEPAGEWVSDKEWWSAPIHPAPAGLDPATVDQGINLNRALDALDVWAFTRFSDDGVKLTISQAITAAREALRALGTKEK